VGIFVLSRTEVRPPTWLRFVLGSFVILYNPIVPIRLYDKKLWKVLNSLTVLSFWIVRSF
jgi:hypothetical protein